ncbi:alpha-L-rhamnosidase [Jejuia pallidilutea]|uniref:alpha-L-rhamnosidase n=1 Tax=Jejuia pallidilutea TaxID=504487 RepID=A0A362X0I0_9FLAO|nr:family 78 glycoside hydrolase catalytic domain [Jejuia pallidilutea]PQV48845.1 alpha-L-rhamnosidase [Jejuia pallidilutea]
MNYRIIPLLLITCAISCKTESSIKIKDLTVEYLNNPLGINRTHPLLSWKLFSEENGKSQSAYRVLIASSEALLEKNEGDIFDTGKIISTKSVGNKLHFEANESNTMYYWKVKVWDENNNPSSFSNTHFWKTGFLKESDWKAKWISNKYKTVTDKREPFTRYDNSRVFVAEDSSAVYLRKVFKTNDSIKTATVYVSGLGYYELYLNGRKVGDHVLDPVFTDYQKNVKYLAYNVTELLKQNNFNTVSAILGNGFYNHTERDLFQMEKANWKTPPKLLCEIIVEYESGTKAHIISDATWKWSYGPIIYNSIRGGETIDARIDINGWNTSNFKDNGWQSVTEVPAPVGKLTYQYMPPMRETKSLKPDSVWNPKKDITVFDFGENITGYADISVKGEAGKVVNIYFNEVLNKDGSLNIKHSSGHTFGRFQHGKLILSEKEVDEFAPRFTYHGFRYVQVEGVPKDAILSIEAKSVHTDLKEVASFESSNLRLNQLHQAVKRTLLNSIHSMPGEEATREKMGWTFDGGMNTMETYFYNFNVINTYKKYLSDLIEAQEYNGHIPPIVPTNGWGFLEKGITQKDTIVQYDDPWWGGTIAFVAKELYENTGDTVIVKNSYIPIREYTDFVLDTAIDDIVYWSLGDWLDLEHNKDGWGPGLTSVALTSTAGLYYLCNITSQFATLLGKNEDARLYADHCRRIKKVFNEKFLNEKTGWYDKKSQTGQAVALYYNLATNDIKEKVAQKLLESIQNNNYHTSVGFIGVRPLIQFLSKNGYKDVMFRLLMQEKSPGWLHFVEDERSTMGENLNAEGYGTNHHPFAANIGYWLFEHLSGFKTDFSKTPTIILKPGLEVDVKWVKTSHETLYGTVTNHWEKKADNVSYKIELPTNVNAALTLPEGFSLTNLKDYDGFISTNENMKTYILSSGEYHLKLIKDSLKQ